MEVFKVKKSKHRCYYVKGKIHIELKLKYGFSRKERAKMPEGKDTGRSIGSNVRLQRIGL